MTKNLASSLPGVWPHGSPMMKPQQSLCKKCRFITSNDLDSECSEHVEEIYRFQSVKLEREKEIKLPPAYE
jgi:hypothetical protein